MIHDLGANKIDVIFIYAPKSVIPEMGIGANSPGPHNIYVAFDPEFKDIKDEDIFLSIMHEAHHCMRWRDPGYGKTLGEAMISEGLATLYEEELSGKPPIYSQMNIQPEEIEEAKKMINHEKYDHAKWFFGTNEITRWFGYTYGYQLCKAYAVKTGKKASQLIHIDAQRMLDHTADKSNI